MKNSLVSGLGLRSTGDGLVLGKGGERKKAFKLTNEETVHCSGLHRLLPQAQYHTQDQADHKQGPGQGV